MKNTICIYDEGSLSSELNKKAMLKHFKAQDTPTYMHYST